MSASLVGSEMCIRDRASLVAGSTAPTKPTPLWLSGARRNLALPSLGPVSYTHLTLPTICSV
eukprot:11595430-Alexandrium_andersonii.AAC.1